MRKNIILAAVVLLMAVAACRNKKNADPAPAVPEGTVPVAPPSSHFLFIADLHLDTLAENHGYGHNHDTSRELWMRLLQQLRTVLNGPTPPDFIICTGDLPAHAPSSGNQHNTNIAEVLDSLRSLIAASKIPFFYMPGNNDGLAGDYSSFANAQGQTPLSLVPENVNPYPALNINPGSKTAPCILDTANIKLGYYSALIQSNLRILALNTVMFSPGYWTPTGTTSGIGKLGFDQLSWMKSQLEAAAKDSQQVYIAMHIPPGLNAYSFADSTQTPTNIYMWNNQYAWQDTFLATVNQYRNNIAGVLYGHTHMDELRRLYAPGGQQITEVAISCPGITPLHSNNPGFKLVQYNPGNKELLDFTTQYTLPAKGSPWSTYQFNTTFGYAGGTLYQNITATDSATLVANMQKIYNVMNGAGPWYIGYGLEVRSGQ